MLAGSKDAVLRPALFLVMRRSGSSPRGSGATFGQRFSSNLIVETDALSLPSRLLLFRGPRGRLFLFLLLPFLGIEVGADPSLALVGLRICCSTVIVLKIVVLVFGYIWGEFNRRTVLCHVSQLSLSKQTAQNNQFSSAA